MRIDIILNVFFFFYFIDNISEAKLVNSIYGSLKFSHCWNRMILFVYSLAKVFQFTAHLREDRVCA